MVIPDIPTVDLSSFIQEGDTKRAREIISRACSEYGFFQIVNHGVPLSLMTKALELSKEFFELPIEDKLNAGPSDKAPLPAGFCIHPGDGVDKSEFLMMFPPGAEFNVFPNDPPKLRNVMEELFCHFTKVASLVESILNDCLGLPPKFLHEYNNDRRWDLLLTWRHLPATEMENQGLEQHQDANCVTYVFMDDEGLEFLKDGVWIPVVPVQGSIYVNVADVIQEGDTKRAREIISRACSEYGFFQIVNHGVPLSLMTKALELSKEFFELPIEDKLNAGPSDKAPLPAGFCIHPGDGVDKSEFLMMFPPGAEFNVFPNDPPKLRNVMEELFCHFTKVASLVESILNDCLGLPPKFLHEYNNDRRWDLLLTWRHLPATEMENQGLEQHQDANCVTYVFMDDEGLEFLKDGVWIPVVPVQGSIYVNVADVIQVLSNNKFKSSIHRVVKQQGKSRHSYAFLNTVAGNKWIEPLPEFTKHVGEPARYRGFFFGDYQQRRKRDNMDPTSRVGDKIDITHYAM